MLVARTRAADLLDELGDVRFVDGVGARVVDGTGDLWGVVAVGRRQLRPAHRPESFADAGRDVVQVRGDGADAIALGGKELIELIDVGFEEVAPRQQRLDLTLDAYPLGLSGPAGLGLGGLDDVVRFALGVGDRGVGGALGEEEGAADRLRLVGRNSARRGS